MPSPLVLTLKLDDRSFQQCNHLRQQHFPVERNFLSAHVTLFHALPAEHEQSICQTLEGIGQKTSAFPLHFPTLRFLGKGVAIEVDSPELFQLRNQLAETWKPWLTPQDRQGYRSHVTIQNKVAPEQARQLYDRLSNQWRSWSGQAEGLLLWYYQGGPWQLAQEFRFPPPNPMKGETKG
jgi:2'-5' RNA ligase